MNYKTIVADPPWKVSRGRPLGLYEIVDGKQIFKSPTDKARPLAYSQMSIDEIAALQVPSADNAHLYLWTINKYVEQAFHVARAWGFKYSTLLTWAKSQWAAAWVGAMESLRSMFYSLAKENYRRLTGLAEAGLIGSGHMTQGESQNIRPSHLNFSTWSNRFRLVRTLKCLLDSIGKVGTLGETKLNRTSQLRLINALEQRSKT